MAVSQATILLCEMYPILREKLPPLVAFHLQTRIHAEQIVTGKLIDEGESGFPRRWVWSAPYIVTDMPQASMGLQTVLQNLQQSNVIEDPHSIQELAQDEIPPQVLADFVARGLWQDCARDIYLLEQQFTRLAQQVRLLHKCEPRGMVVDGQAVLSLSLESILISLMDLYEYHALLPDTQEMLGLSVSPKGSTQVGLIASVQGVFSRSPFLSTRDRSNQFDEPEPQIQVYFPLTRILQTYSARALAIVIRPHDCNRFGVDRDRVEHLMYLSLGQRQKMGAEFAALAQARGWIGSAYSLPSLSAVWQHTDSFRAKLCVGEQQQVEAKSLLTALRRYGVSRRHLSRQQSLNFALVKASPDLAHEPVLKNLQEELAFFQFKSHCIYHETSSTLANPGELARIFQRAQEQEAQMVFFLLEGDQKQQKDEATSLFSQMVKAVSIPADIPAQVLYHTALQNHWTFSQIALRSLRKLGNILHTLCYPLSYADLVVGLDLITSDREVNGRKNRLLAVARVFLPDGEFLLYTIQETIREGNTLTPSFLQSFLPADVFARKRVVFHIEGQLQEAEKQALQGWGKRIGALFSCVEISASGVPHLYSRDQVGMESEQERQGWINQGFRGTTMKLAPQAALINPAPREREQGMQPLSISGDAFLPIEQAVHSVLTFKQLQYGELKPSSLPITIDERDEIAALLLRGVKPGHAQGKRPFWI